MTQGVPGYSVATLRKAMADQKWSAGQLGKPLDRAGIVHQRRAKTGGDGTPQCELNVRRWVCHALAIPLVAPVCARRDTRAASFVGPDGVTSSGDAQNHPR